MAGVFIQIKPPPKTVCTHHPRMTIVKIFVSMHESYVKMGVFVLRFQGHQAYNRFMEGKKGFQGSKAQFLV